MPTRNRGMGRTLFRSCRGNFPSHVIRPGIVHIELLETAPNGLRFGSLSLVAQFSRTLEARPHWLPAVGGTAVFFEFRKSLFRTSHPDRFVIDSAEGLDHILPNPARVLKLSFFEKCLALLIKSLRFGWSGGACGLQLEPKLFDLSP